MFFNVFVEKLNDLGFFPVLQDLDQAAQICYDAIFANHGQNCCAGSRTFVQDGVYDK